MITSNLLILFIYFVILLKFSKSIKWWVENPEFKNQGNWENGKIACAKDKIIFPKSFSSAIYTPIDLETNGIVFPKEGTILLHKNSKISFTNVNENKKNKDNKEKCVNENNFAKIKNQRIKNWFDPENWIGEGQNPATPHIERIPCSNEKVVMGLNGALSIDLDYVDELYIGGLHMGQKDLTAEQLQLFFQTEIGQSIFKNAENTDVKYLSESICGCHKLENVVEYQWKVCKFVRNTCGIPKCLNPIVPTGHCCNVCGSSVKLHINNCTDFNMNLFKTQLNKALNKEQELADEVYIDYRIVNDGGDIFLQLVVLDKDVYNENSIKLMNILKDTVLKRNYQNIKQTFHMSGSPYTPGTTSSGWIFMLTSLLGVLTFFAILIVYFMPEKSPITLPAWLYSNRYNFNSPFVFARFDNSQTDVEISGRPVNTTDLVEENADTIRGTTSFNNPMFDENAEKPETQGIGCPLESEMSEIELGDGKQE